MSDRLMIVNDNAGREQMIPNKSCRESSDHRFKGDDWCLGNSAQSAFIHERSFRQIRSSALAGPASDFRKRSFLEG